MTDTYLEDELRHARRYLWLIYKLHRDEPGSHRIATEFIAQFYREHLEEQDDTRKAFARRTEGSVPQ